MADQRKPETGLVRHQGGRIAGNGWADDAAAWLSPLPAEVDPATLPPQDDPAVIAARQGIREEIEAANADLKAKLGEVEAGRAAAQANIRRYGKAVQIKLEDAPVVPDPAMYDAMVADGTLFVWFQRYQTWLRDMGSTASRVQG